MNVVLYTRQGCHLCDDALQILGPLQARYGFDLRAVDIDADAELVCLHGERVPVLVVDGVERCWGRINRVLAERAVRAKQ
jgi:glutaredoxin